VVDEVDGERYVDTIEWFMIKGTSIRSKHEFPPIRCCHTLAMNKEAFNCEELVYVSDTATESHYPLDDGRNRDAQIAGRIEIDMSFLITGKIIKPERPEKGKQGVPHYKVEFDLVPIVEGRSLRYEARYPPGAGKKGKVLKFGQISLAAAFRPGTT